MNSLEKVLIIDDDPFQCELLRSYFEECAVAEIREATNGRAAVSLLEDTCDEPFDLIVTDLHMPDMDGMELIAYLNDKQSTTPLLIVSGGHQSLLNAAKALADAHGLTILGVVTKPLKFTELDRAVFGDAASPRATRPGR